MQVKNITGTFILSLLLLVACNQQNKKITPEANNKKKLSEFSGKELYAEMEARSKSKLIGEKKLIDTPPVINHDFDVYTDKELYNALEVIYGIDNRKNPYDKSITDSNILSNYKKVACLVDASQLQLLPDSNFKLTPSKTYTSLGGRPLCSEESFYGEPIASFCTGFAVSQTMFATAGHCLNAQTLQNTLFIYGFAMKDSVTPNLIINKANIYKPKKIIGHELNEQTKSDFCIVEVDKKIPANLICKVRKADKISDNQKLYVIGYPSGLPVKITPDGKVYTNDNNIYFVTNLDTYGGNSGSPVFNANTHAVEGILVRGATDYAFWDVGGCIRSNICPENIGTCNGEDVTRASQFVKLIK